MPYITEADRKKVEYYDRKYPETAGELNYCISVLCSDYLKRHKLSYSTINEIMGVLECAKAEFYRRVATPYENKKLEDNGDVY